MIKSTTLLLCAGLIAGCAPRNEFQAPPPPKVTVATPLVEDVTIYHDQPGRLGAVDTVEIRARVTGYLKQAFFRDGERVSRGQRLFQIEPESYQASVQSAEAALEQAKATASLAQTALERKRLAFETQAVSELEVLGAEADLQVATATIQSAEAALEQARLNLSYTEVHAPMDGRIARNLVSAGNLVSGSNATLLSTIVSENPIHCYFAINERIYMKYAKREGINSAKPDTPGAGVPRVRLELANGELYSEEGVIDYVDNAFDDSTATLTVRARFDNPSMILSPGMFGRIKIPEQLAGATMVPELCVQRDMGGAFVFTVKQDGMVERRSLVLGPLAGEFRVVQEGLEPSDRVIIKGLQKAREGIQVDTESTTLSLSDS